MTRATSTITVQQGSQPNFGNVLVGIFQAGTPDGVLTVRLLVRGPNDQKFVDLVPGGSTELFGAGILTVDGITLKAPEGPARDEVTLTFAPTE